jgi:murein DD-endopeptidase MepM/ murein hydrolase activator NlpD
MKSRRAGIAALSSLLLAAALLTPASASDDPKDLKRQVDAAVDELEGDVHESTAEVAEATRLLADADARLPAAQAALEQARAALAGASEHESAVAARLAETMGRAEQAAEDYERVRRELEGHREAVGAIARQAYIGGDMAKLKLAMNAESPDDFSSALAYLRAVNRSEHVTIGRLGREQEDAAELQARLEAIRQQVVAEQAEASAAVEATRGAAAAAEVATGAVAALVEQRTKALAVAEDERDTVVARYEEMKAESDRLARIIAERAAAARRAAAAAEAAARRKAAKSGRIGKKLLDTGGTLLRPVIGPITSGFGMRYHPILRYYKLHTGTDFGVPTGTAVHAARGGTVLQSYYNSAYGNRVTVDHGLVNGVYLVTTYNHLSRSTVHAGERLKAGEVLGYSGSTGWSTGPHLHFETLEDGRFVNPMKWLR